MFIDMYNIREAKGSLKGLEVAIIGDIYHSRVAEVIYGNDVLGAEVSVAGPATLLPVYGKDRSKGL